MSKQVPDTSSDHSDAAHRAVVTGASAGIGREIASRLASEGWIVFNVDRVRPADTGREASTWVEADLADEASLDAALARILAHGPVTGLVNNAAVGRMGLLEQLDSREMDESYAINQRAPALCAARLVAGMREAGHGRIVNIASRAHLGKTHRTAYAATKGAVVSMTKVWALELAAHGITCNAIAPGPVRTELFDAVNPPEMPRTRAIVHAIPVGRIGQPQDVANAAAFFMDRRSGFVTGQVLYVCGGVTLARGGS